MNLKPDLAPPASSRPLADAGGGIGMARGERADHVWQALVPRLLHPVKLTIIESLLWTEDPLSASKLAGMLEDSDEHPLATLSYHMRLMADAGVLEIFERCAVRGATETFYVFHSAQS